ncbi:MAG: hypothetical protein IKN17_09685 [Ruminococcus sp.]|nr:hypothetical protein [Ruminococcus sp.]
MRSKRIPAAAAAVIMALSCAFSAFAEPAPLEPAETGEGVTTSQTEVQTTAAETEATTEATPAVTTSVTEATGMHRVETTAPQGGGSEGQQTQAPSSAATTTSMTTPVAREIKPTKVFLTIGDIKDDEFDVTLNVDPDPETLISSATIKIEYDDSLMELRGSLINTASIGGQPTEEEKDGVYTFNYINPKGTTYRGVYATLKFKITDMKMTSSVIYVSVENLEDTDLLAIANNIQNGIVKYREDTGSEPEPADDSSLPEDDSSQELPVLTVKAGALPMTLDELSVPDVKNIKSVKVLDTSLAIYEQGALTALAAGETEMVVKYNSGKELHFKLTIDKADEPVSAAETSSAAEPVQDTSGRTFAIAVAVMIGIAAIAVEYILIMKPFGRKNIPDDDDEEEEQYVAYDDDDDTEMVQNPEEVFARRVKPEEKKTRPNNNKK